MDAISYDILVYIEKAFSKLYNLTLSCLLTINTGAFAMPQETMDKKKSRIDWKKMKIKFLTGNYKSLRDFAKKLV